MLLRFCKIFLLIGSVIASASNEKLYDKAKEKILRLAQEKYKKHGEIVRIDSKKFTRTLETLSKIRTNDLFDLLNAEDCEEFLAIYWYGYSGKLPFLVFRNISSLSRHKNFPKGEIQLKEIFEKFLEFLFWRLRNMNNNCCSSSHNLSASINLLGKVEAFWNNKLERLAKRLLSKDEFNEQLMEFKTWMKFLYQFYNRGVEFMLLQEYKNLKQEIRLNGIENSKAEIKRFQFLTEHFKQHLVNYNLPGSHEKWAWFSGRDALFIIYYFYFYKKLWDPIGELHPNNYRYLLQKNYEIMRKPVEEFLYLGSNFFRIFWENVKDPTVINLANTILEKTQTFITK
jgi:hypothetical protein